MCNILLPITHRIRVNKPKTMRVFLALCAMVACAVAAPTTECAAVWEVDACANGECYTCGARITYVIGTGSSEAAAANTVAGEFPMECGACLTATPPPTAPPSLPADCQTAWTVDACDVNKGGCATCGARVVYLQSTGASLDDALFQVAAEFPTECGVCGAASASTFSPATPDACRDVWFVTACSDALGGCHSCGSRISYSVGQGSTMAAAMLLVASQFPSACGPCGPAPTPTAGLPTNTLTLVWEDDFDGDALNTSLWGYDLGTGVNGWGNAELQTYTTAAATVSGGTLKITTTKTASGYESARVLTKDKGDWMYGRIEVRAKLPRGRGTWPAIWMLPTDSKYGTWPASGEIDNMEHVGYAQGVVHGTVHTAAGSGASGTSACVNTGNASDATCATELPSVQVSSEFHVYTIVWSETEIEWYLDDTRFDVYTKEADADYTTWPFDADFHLLINTAVGGNWGGVQGVDDSIFPQVFEVDYVRVYQDTPTTRPPPDVTFAPPTAPPTLPEPCQAVWFADACDDAKGGCHTCGSRITYLVSQGQTIGEASAAIASEFPVACAGCDATHAPDTTPPTNAPVALTPCEAVWDNDACDTSTGECYTCGARITYLTGQMGYTQNDAEAKISLDFPTACGDCSNATAAPPVAPASLPQLCQDVWNANACDDAKGGCHTCGARITYITTTTMTTLEDAVADIAAEFPTECGACNATHAPDTATPTDVPTPVPTPVPVAVPVATCASVQNNQACDAAHECATCGERIAYLMNNMGYAREPAEKKIAGDFILDCGACMPEGAPSAPDSLPQACQVVWNANACDHNRDGCHTCGERITYVQNTGKSLPDAASDIAAEFPSACGLCGGTDAPVAVSATAPAACQAVWFTNACSDQYDGCHTCGSRIEHLKLTITETAAMTQVASEFPAQCGACAESAPPTPAPSTPAPISTAPDTAEPTTAPKTAVPTTAPDTAEPTAQPTATPSDAPATSAPPTDAPDTPSPPTPSPPRTWCSSNSDCRQYDAQSNCTDAGRCFCSAGFVNPADPPTGNVEHVCVGDTAAVFETVSITWDASCDVYDPSFDAQMAELLSAIIGGTVVSVTVHCGSLNLILGVEGVVLADVAAKDIAAELSTGMEAVQYAEMNTKLGKPKSAGLSSLVTSLCNMDHATTLVIIDAKCFAVACESGYAALNGNCVSDSVIDTDATESSSGSGGGDSGLPTALIPVIVVCSLVVLVAIIVTIFCCLRKQKREGRLEQEQCSENEPAKEL